MEEMGNSSLIFSFTLILFPIFKAMKESRPSFGLEADWLPGEKLNVSEAWTKKVTVM